MPGFIDGHCHWEAFWGELYLHLGITTCVEIETNQNGVWALAQKDGTNMGKIRGPRIWPSGQVLGARVGELETEGSRAWRGFITIAHPDAARSCGKEADGYEGIKVSEFLSPDILASREAHRLGVTGHSRDVVAYSKAGVDGSSTSGVGYIDQHRKGKKLAVERPGGSMPRKPAHFTRSKVSTRSRPWSTQGGLDADHRQVAAPAFAQRGALLETRAGDPRQSEGEIPGRGACRD
jgi:hypothetical protein